MAEGRSFSEDFPSDTTEAILVNETAATKAGWDDPIGKRLEMVEIDGSLVAKRVVGVVKDFHFTNAKQEIEPLIFQYNTQNTFLILIKLAAGDFSSTIANIEEIYKEILPNNNFNSQFLDDQFDQQFQDDREFATNIAYFSGFAIFIACMGLIGLVAFAVDQRKAEIAVRKVLGSSEVTIIYLLSKDFLKWVLIANIIAWPLSYYAIGLWLDGFVYKVSLSPFPFVIAGFTALIIAFGTMLYQSIKASYANPVDSLRNE
jgi:putative ABC transport system permease protein